MIKYRIYVENVINGAGDITVPSTSTNDEKRYLSAATQLIKNWQLFIKDPSFQVDFEISLRDFLLLIKSTIKIANYALSHYAIEYLSLFKINDNIGVSPSFPKYINNDFIHQCYRPVENAKTQKSPLKTNEYIRELTDFSYFKSEEQKLSVLGALNTPKGFTTLISMSTGGGKSLVVQTVAYQSSGLTLVVVPTVSLMLDQVRNARLILNPNNPDEVSYYNSDTDATKIAKLIKQGVIKILFISPEAIIKNDLLRDIIEKENEVGNLNNLIIDEAHIVVEWGTSFRIDFQCLDALRKKWLSKNRNLRTFLLSATFSKHTVDILKRSFSEGNNWIEIRCDSLRKEPRYYFERVASHSDKSKKQIELIMKLPHPMIVYVQRPQDAIDLQETLKQYGVNNAQIFTGRTSASQRDQLINMWTNDEFQIMIATCAFGVGVDKKNVRTVLHLYVPDNPNKYYQEAGRGGRDGYPCLSVMLYESADLDSAFGLTTKTMTAKKINDRWFSMINSLNTIKYGDGKVLIDTSAKPSYSESDEFLDWANEKDINWNVYVIMLLKRAGLLEITDVEFKNGKDLFMVELINRGLLNESEKIQEKIQIIRDKEWKEVESEFKLVKDMLKYSSDQCVSDTFCEIYDLADPCCSGCKSHSIVIESPKNKFPLKKQISYFEDSDFDGASPFFKGNHFAVIKFDNLQYVLETIENYMDSVVVGENHEDDRSRKYNTFDLWEFVGLCNYMPSLLGKNVAVLMDNDEQAIHDILLRAKTVSNKYKINFAFLVSEDYHLPIKNKKLSEIVEGPLYQEYILEDVARDV